MKLYLTRYSITKIEYESIEDGYTKLTLPREGYPSGEDIPKIIEVDYWEVFGD
jgi:hypothetical protein